jgi:hypothetical protein
MGWSKAMAKEIRTAEQLAEMIERRIGVADVRVQVFYDEAIGWRATVHARGNAFAYQRIADDHAKGLRALFDLAT